MDVCAFCKSPIQDYYFRVISVIACPACVEKERQKDILTRGRYFRLGLLYACGAACAASLVLWGVQGLAALGGGIFSAGAFLRGTALVAAGRLIGAAAMKGARRRGSKPLQVSAAFLTYMAWSMSFVWLVLSNTHFHPSSVITVASVVAMGPLIPWMMVFKNPLGISGIVVAFLACGAAWQATAGLNLVEGPFDRSEKAASVPERQMFGSLS